MHKKIFKALFFLIFFAAVSCTSKNELELPRPIEPAKFEICTDVNSYLVSKVISSTIQNNCHFIVEPHMVRVVRLKRDQSFLRRGPSHKFDILDEPVLLTENLIVLYQIDQWTKVLNTNNGKIGWLHIKQLAKRLQKIPSDFKLAVRHLPFVFVTQLINKAESHNGKKVMRVSFPKGRKFRTLINGSRKVLVYLSNKKKPIWLKRGLVE